MQRYRVNDEERAAKMLSLGSTLDRFVHHVVVRPDDVIGPDEPVEVPDEAACDRCHGVGWLRRDVAADHPEFGKPVPCPCPRGQAARQRALERVWESAGIPKEFSAYTVESWLRRNRGKKQLVDDLLAWEETEAWAVFTGPVGVGKSALAAIMAHRALKRGRTAMFRVAPDVLDRIYSAMGRPRDDDEPSPWDVMQSLTEPDWLVLDDFVVGYKPMRDDAQERFWRLIDQRKRERKKTVITSNVPMLPEHRDPTKPRQKLMSEMLWEQTFDRIRGMSQVFNLTGVSQRRLEDVTRPADDEEELPF